MKPINFQFTKVPTDITRSLKFTPMEKTVYSVIRSFGTEGDPSSTFPSRRTIAAATPCSISTVVRAIKKLEDSGRMTHVRGCTGKCNTYQFFDPVSGADGATHDTIYDSSMTPSSIVGDTSPASSRTHYPEPYTKNHKPERRARLFHRSELCSVTGETIKIHTPSGEWLPYGGGDEEGFRFKNLRGTEARKAAISYFSGNGPGIWHGLNTYANS